MSRLVSLRRGLFPILGAAFLVCGALTGWIVAELRQEVRRVQIQAMADSWYLDQAIFELGRFMYALAAHVAGSEEVDFKTVQVRFDVFWSRIPVISEGELAQVYRRWLGGDDYVSGWPAALAQIDAELRGRTQARNDVELLARIEHIVAPLREKLRKSIVEFGVLHDSQDAEAVERLKRLTALHGALTAVFLLASTALIALLFHESRLARRAEAEARTSKERFRHFAESGSDWLWETNSDLELIYVSGQVANTIGMPPASIIGRRLSDIMNHSQGRGDWREYLHASASRSAFRDLALEFDSAEGKSRTVRISGEPVFESDGRFLGYRGVCTEISDQIDQERRIRFLAEHDQLTGLPNRAFFNARFEHALAIAQRQDARIALLLVDLDQFKEVNDSHGHDVGDALLVSVARTLELNLRESDTLARLGGDEFAIILEYFHDDPWECERFAERVVEEVQRPVRVDGYTLQVGASIGIAFYPDDGVDITELLKAADLALYRAKDLGRGRVQFFLQEMNDQLQRKKLLEAELAKALENRALDVYFQPQFLLDTGTLSGAEALLRWRHPELGFIEPAEFVGVAEACGLIIPIGQWVLESACREASEWVGDLTVSVNLSPAQFSSKDLSLAVKRVLVETGLPARRLQLEITEGLLIRDTQLATSILDELHGMGVRVAIDDFGMGYSSLSYLKRFSIDAVKVDRTFVKGIGEAEDDRSIVRGIVTLAQALRIRTIAEGVESSEQLEAIRSLGCDEAQGYYFGRPVPAEEFRRTWVEEPGGDV